MKKEVAEAIAEVAPDLELRDDYSGRGMYGKNTYAICCDDITDLVGAAIEAVIDAMSDDRTDDAWEIQRAFERIRSDSMGLGQVFY